MAVGMTFLVGCSDDKDSATPVRAVITENGDQIKLDIPSNIKGGVVNLSLTNSGQHVHSLQFVKVTGEHSSDDVLSELITSGQGAPIPDWVSEGGGIGTVAPGQTGTASFRLSAGTHFAWDDETDENDTNNATKGAISEITVTAGNGGSLPDADGTVTAKEYEFTTNGLKAGTSKVMFDNTGKEFHHFIAAPLQPGKTIEDVKTFFATEGEPTGEPPINFDKGVGVAVVGPGNAEVSTVTLEPGNYAMVCFLNDRAGGAPHFTMGMTQQFSVK
jgi:hypothetical protein